MRLLCRRCCLCFALIVPQDLDQEVYLGVDRGAVDTAGRAEVGLKVQGKGVHLLVKLKARRLVTTAVVRLQMQRPCRTALVGRLRRVVALRVTRATRHRRVAVDRQGRAPEWPQQREMTAGRRREAEATANTEEA